MFFKSTIEIIKTKSYKNINIFNKSITTSCYVWGQNQYGQLGIGNQINSLLPTLLKCPEKGANIKFLSCGLNHSALITSHGNLYTFGLNDNHQLGINSNKTTISIPTRVDKISDVKEVSCGDKHTLALTNSGSLYSWGYGGSYLSAGALGHGNTKNVSSPKKIETNIIFKSISSGSYHNLAVSENKKIYSWGKSESGRLGILTGLTMRGGILNPKKIDFTIDNNIKKVIATGSFSAAISEDNILYMWGKNDFNQLGTSGLSLDIYNAEPIPVEVKTSDNEKFKVNDIACSHRHSIAISENNRLYWWGERLYMTPVKVDGFDKEVKYVAACNKSNLCITKSGSLYSWGDHASSCLGFQGNETKRPTLIETLKNYKAIYLTSGPNHVGCIVEDE